MRIWAGDFYEAAGAVGQFEADFGSECNAVDEEMLLVLEQDNEDLRTSMRWLIHQVRILLPQARNIRAEDWQHPDWLRALAIVDN